MKFTKLLSILILLSLLLSSCVGIGDTTTELQTDRDTYDESYTATDPPLPEPLLCGTRVSEYTIVISKNANDDEEYAADMIAKAVLAQTGKNIKISKYAEGRAILVGRTDQTPEEYTAKDVYAVGTIGENVIVCGGGGLTVRAARKFVEMLLKAAGSRVDPAPAEPMAFERADLPALGDFGEKPIALADQKNASIAVYDIASGTAELKFEFKPTAEAGFNLNGYENRVDEARLRYSAEWGTYIIGFTSSSGFAGIASYPEGKRLWQTSLGKSSPHTIEYIPGGYIAVASSGGSDTSKGVIRLYSLESGKSYGYAKLTSAHGLLWDETRELLWALGSSDIVAYEIGGTPEKPELIKVPFYGTTAMQGGHDLSAIPGDDDRVWVGGSFVRIFDKTTGELIDSYPGSMQISKPNVKCICSFPDGSMALTVATGVFASHDTDRFKLYIPSISVAEEKEFVFESRAFYKARAFIASYN